MAGAVVHRPLRILRFCIAMAGTIASPPLAGAAEPVIHRVLIEKFAFVPERLEIRSGDTVEWVNRDIAPHTATASDQAWTTSGLTRGRSAEISFSVPRAFAYFCSYHPHMQGEIIVVAE